MNDLSIMLKRRGKEVSKYIQEVENKWDQLKQSEQADIKCTINNALFYNTVLDPIPWRKLIKKLTVKETGDLY